MTPRDFTEKDIQLVARYFREERFGDPERNARAVLQDLANAGRLLPEGAARFEEIGVRVDEEHPRRKEKVGKVMTGFPRENALYASEIWQGWTPVRRTVIHYVGEWVEVGSTPEESREHHE